MENVDFWQMLADELDMSFDDLSLVMGIIAAYVLLIIIGMIIGYIITSISYMGLCAANGHSKGAAWVPFYRKWLFGEFIGKANGCNATLFSVWFCFGAFVSAIPAVGTIAIGALGLLQYVFIIMAVYKTRKANGGNEILFMVLTILFPVLAGFFLPDVNFDDNGVEVIEPVQY